MAFEVAIGAVSLDGSESITVTFMGADAAIDAAVLRVPPRDPRGNVLGRHF